MDVREKLDKLLGKWLGHLSLAAANDLIANGVTFDKDINVPTKWISVKDRLPEKKGGYIVCTDKGGILLSHWYGNKWGGGYASKHITHWMNKPQPPKGE